MRILLPALAAATLLLPAHASLAQPPRQPHAGELAANLHRLGVLGSVLYVAAHPDDENSRLLAWLVGARGLRAGYLSMTRGDGGQNLLGTEQDDLLGLLRTHELLAARRVDGAEQWFTRARDLGYTKSAAEALQIWGHDAVLADVVLAIRRFKPDVVITRFTTKPPNHGHHTASALLAEEAFAAAADPKRFPEQLSEVQPWQGNRLLYNVSSWNLKPDADMSAYLKQDVGGFDPLRGRSWGEVAAESRSQHKSQGFGVAADRGTSAEYFAPLAGHRPKADMFEGLDLTWRRYPGTENVVKAVAEAETGFDPKQPAKSIPALWRVHASIAKLPADNQWKALKLHETEALIAACAGLFLEARASEPSATPGSELTLSLVAVNRAVVPVRLIAVHLADGVTAVDTELRPNLPVSTTHKLRIGKDAAISSPYWLQRPTEGGLDDVPDRRLIGRPEGDPALTARFELDIGGQRLTLSRPVVNARVDPVRGELTRHVEIVPAVTATLDRKVVMVPNGQPQPLTVLLAAGRDGATGTVRLQLPSGWRAQPAEVPFLLVKRGDELTARFQVTPAKNATARAQFQAVTVVGGRTESWNARTIDYAHVPPLTVRQPSAGVLVPLQLATKIKHIAYIPGPGDRVAECLSAVGYDVTVLPEDRLATEPLARFDAILVGIRAFNANARLILHRDRLLQYVEQGGRLIVQYQTNNRLAALDASIGPYPLEIGRDRVTDENALMTPLDPKDPLLAQPNQLVPADFTGWVQERGLYFAAKWDERYRPVFTMQDPGEPGLRGALLVARHGKGAFVYTGLAFFRELPAGVPGAYRLLANLLAL